MSPFASENVAKIKKNYTIIKFTPQKLLERKKVNSTFVVSNVVSFNLVHNYFWSMTNQFKIFKKNQKTDLFLMTAARVHSDSLGFFYIVFTRHI